MRLPTTASSRATSSALEMLSISNSCPGAMRPISRTIAFVCSNELPGSARSRERSRRMSSSETGRLLRMVPCAALAIWKPGMMVLANVSGVKTTVNGT